MPKILIQFQDESIRFSINDGDFRYTADEWGVLVRYYQQYFNLTNKQMLKLSGFTYVEIEDFKNANDNNEIN